MTKPLFLLCIILVSGYIPIHAQECTTNHRVVHNKTEWATSIHGRSSKQMIALKELIPALIVNLPYATTHNFTHTVLYKHPVAYLRLKPALALRQIDSALRKQGFALMLYDAFRPYKVTCLMWQLTPNKRYVADPARGSGHNRGIAVDLNIVNLKTGKELNMGTPFDSFSSKSHHSCTTFSDEILTNRQLLKTTMERYGFRAMDAEWWHYFWVNDEGYEIIDMDFDSLK